MIHVRVPGACTSLQDLGRSGWQSRGIGAAGAMDAWAARVANTLLDMAIMGLSMSKDQCYPIAYGQELTCFVSVWGKIAAFKRLKGVEGDPVANLIYEGDEVEIDNSTGEVRVTHLVVNGTIRSGS